MRFNAATVLGQVLPYLTAEAREKEALPTLRKLSTSDPDDDTRYFATMALKQPTAPGLPALVYKHSISSNSFTSLKELGLGLSLSAAGPGVGFGGLSGIDSIGSAQGSARVGQGTGAGSNVSGPSYSTGFASEQGSLASRDHLPGVPMRDVDRSGS